jgi:hypothetical protein
MKNCKMLMLIPISPVFNSFATDARQPRYAMIPRYISFLFFYNITKMLDKITEFLCLLMLRELSPAIPVVVDAAIRLNNERRRSRRMQASAQETRRAEKRQDSGTLNGRKTVFTFHI